MPSELLPSPDMHSDWQSFARALIAALDGNLGGADFGTIQHVVTTTPVTPGQLPPLPANYVPVWLNNTDAMLYLGNEAYDPPNAPDIVFIDTAKLADAAVNVNKLADGAVTSAKILNATIGSADIGNAQIISALIADLAVVTAKINDLAVNTAKIADLAVSSAKIANLAVGTAHIQAAAITSALIGNAQILTAHIADAQIVNAKIGNTIQSASWNPTTKQGWLIDKTGLIQGSGIAIYDSSGNLVFGSGGTVAWSAITGYAPGGNANRVPYSRFELGLYGYGIRSNPSGLSATSGTKVSGNRDYVTATATFTASSQVFTIGTDITKPDMLFPVGAGERLSVSARLEVTGPAGMLWQLNIQYYDAAGAYLTGQNVVVGTGPVAIGTLQAGFVTVPAGAVRAYLEVLIGNQTSGNAARTVSFSEPQVVQAAANQTTHPNFSPGPNGFIEQLVAGNVSTFIANAAIGQAQIANLAVGTAQIQDLAVTSAKVLSLDAAKINAASLSAITAVIGLLRTASSGARLEIESNQIRVYDSSNVLRVRMGLW
jgi:hypothetical protein